MDDAPAVVERDGVVEELDRTAPVRGEAVLDVLHLLRDVDVHRALGPALRRPPQVLQGNGT
jgi:hypothetical protein